MKKFLVAALAAISVGFVAAPVASAAKVTTSTPGVVSIRHAEKGDVVHWKDWASFAKANGVAAVARKSDWYLDCSGPVPPGSECSNPVYSPGSQTYFHMGNAQWFLAYAADYCGAWYCRTSSLASNYFGTTYNNRVAGHVYSYRISNNSVHPAINWYQWGLRKYCWFTTTTIGSDLSASVGTESLSYGCGTY